MAAPDAGSASQAWAPGARVAAQIRNATRLWVVVFIACHAVRRSAGNPLGSGRTGLDSLSSPPGPGQLTRPGLPPERHRLLAAQVVIVRGGGEPIVAARVAMWLAGAIWVLMAPSAHYMEHADMVFTAMRLVQVTGYHFAVRRKACASRTTGHAERLAGARPAPPGPLSSPAPPPVAPHLTIPPHPPIPSGGGGEGEGGVRLAGPHAWPWERGGRGDFWSP